MVGALADDLDRLATDLAGVRRAHRLAHADTLADLLLLGGLHGLTRDDLEPLFARAAWTRTLLARLTAALGGPPAARDAAAEALLDLWGIDAPAPRLALFAADLDAAARRLAAAVAAALGYRATVEAARARITRICQIHAGGNGTVRTLLAAAVNALDLEIDAARNASVRNALGLPAAPTADPDGVFHSPDLFWHATFVRDRWPLLPGAAPAREALGIEENPLRRQTYENEECTDGRLFTVVRRGFGRELLRAEVVGVGDRTLGPMVVNRDEGRGIGFFGPVADGKPLSFTEEGRVTLDGADVTSFAYSWQGACFTDRAGAGGGPADPHDFVFAGPGVDPRRRAVFAVATPAGALEPDFTFPHAGGDVTPPGIGIGVTRLAFFVQVAHLGARVPGPPPAIHSVSPRPRIAFADLAVFAGSPAAPAAKAADLHLSWLEHTAYALRVVIPARFGRFDGDGPTPPSPSLTDRVATALERFRPAGVAVKVELADDRWALGTGVVTDAVASDPISLLRGGTVLTPSPHGP